MDAGAKQAGNLAVTKAKSQVIVIAANEQQQDRLRVAAYARVSSNSDDQLNSFAAQVRHYTDLISANAQWTLADIYADEDITGTDADKRDEFQRLLADCRRGKIDRILVKSISRFARNTMDCLAAVRELKTLGVSVLFEHEGIDTSRASGEMLTAIFAGFAQAESENISKNMRWSYQRRMEKGTFLPSSMPYGYELRDGRITINEERAAIVRWIFAVYLMGSGVETIAAELTKNGVPHKNVKITGKWRVSTVSGILSNESYIGDSLWQKQYSTDTPPAKRVQNKGERTKYYAENTHPAIISEEKFHAVQELLNKRRLHYATTLQMGNISPLKGKIRCNSCKSFVRKKTIRNTTYWVCSRHEENIEACSVCPILEAEIYAAFLRLYHKLKNHGEPILQQMLNQLLEVRQKRFLWRTDIIELNKKIAALSDQDRTLNELKLAGVIDPDIFISESNSLAAQLRTAKLAKERLLATGEDDSISRTRELMELLAEELNRGGVAYQAGKAWNKNMVARILADQRYLGADEYPELVDEATFTAANQTRPDRYSPEKRDPAIKELQRLATCGCCGGETKRISHRHGRERWQCPICKSISPQVSDKLLLANTAQTLNALINDPAQVIEPPPDHLDNSLPILRLQSELDRELDQPECDEEAAREIIRSIAAARFAKLGSADYESERIRRLLNGAAPAEGLNIELLLSITQGILIHNNGTVDLKLRNGQTMEGSETM